jgi:tetratricopeptide (TPR) repeat protein
MLNNDVLVRREDVELSVYDDARGRFVLLMADIEQGIRDCISVGVSHLSLNALRALDNQSEFSWVNSDKSLSIAAKNGSWDMTFRTHTPPMEMTLCLDDLETKRVRVALLSLDTRISSQASCRSGVEIGRNDVCPCGSGRKYKKCCLPKQSSSSLPDVLRFLEEVDIPEVGALLEVAVQMPSELGNWEFWTEMGRQLGSRGRHDLALTAFIHSKRLAPDDALVILNEAVTLDYLGRSDEALALVDTVGDGSNRKAVIKANILKGRGEYDESIKYYEMAIQEEPDFWLPYVNLIELLKLAQSPLVEYWLKLAIKNVPASPNLAVNYCQHLHEESRLQELIDATWIDNLQVDVDASDIIGGNQDHHYMVAAAQAYRALAHSLVDNDQKSLKKAVGIVSAIGKGWHTCDLAKTLVAHAANLGDPESVEESYAHVCPACRADGRGLAVSVTTCLAVAYRERGDLDQAVTHARLALQAHDEDKLAHAVLYWCHCELGAHGEAYDAGKRLYLIDPKFDHVLRNLAIICCRLGRLGLAEKYLCEESSIQPDNIGAQMALAYVQLLNGKIEEAQARWRNIDNRTQAIVEASGEDDFDLLMTEGVVVPYRKVRAAWDALCDRARSLMGSVSYTDDLIVFDEQAAVQIGPKTTIAAANFSVADIVAALARPNSDEQIEIARQLTAFARGDMSAHVARLKTIIPIWDELPIQARTSLLEAERRYTEACGADFALEVVAFAKALEVCLRLDVFDVFSRVIRADYRFAELIAEASMEPFKQIQTFVKFLSSGQHIELGSMVHTMNLLHGRTAAKARILGEFREHITNRLGWGILLQRGNLDNMKDLGLLRNPAAHSDILGRNEVARARELSLGVLGQLPAKLA